MAPSDNSDEEMDGLPEGHDEWEQWDEAQGGDGPAPEEQTCRSLFSDRSFATPEEAFAHDAKHHGFDLRRFARRHRLTDYDCIKAVNFIRAEVAAGRDPLPALLGARSITAPSEMPFAGDQWLTPVLEDDGLMFHDFEADCCGIEGEDGGGGDSRSVAPAASAEAMAVLLEENCRLKEALEELKWSVLPAELQEDGRRGSGEASAGPSSGPGGCLAASLESVKGKAAKEDEGVEEGQAQRVDRSYFDGYGGFGIHREMLGDRHRTETYRRALECNPSTVAGKRVLDVGCGTGILSLFAARGGAASVVAVDGSTRIAGFAKRIVELNGHGPGGSGKISVVVGKVEELPELPGAEQKVDIIVSEWMGYALLFETMLDSVFAARDRWLRPGGAMMPDRASLFVAAGGRKASGLSFWDDVYGFDMTPIREEAHAAAMKSAIVRVVRPPPNSMLIGEVGAVDLLSPAVCIKEWDLMTSASRDLDFTCDFRLILEETKGEDACGSIVLWFDTDFSERVCPDMPVVLTTSPCSEPTHWAQTVLPLSTPIGATKAEAIAGRVSFAARKDAHRSLDIAVECWAELKGGGKGDAQSAIYNMGVNQDP